MGCELETGVGLEHYAIAFPSFLLLPRALIILLAVPGHGCDYSN